MLVEVASYLNLREICQLGAACKRMKEISENLNLWASFLPGVPLEDKKTVFVRRIKVRQNVERRVAIPCMLQGHTDMILSIDVQGDNVLSTSRDNTVKKWNVATKKGVSYSGHADWVVSAKFYDGGVISASADRSVRLWKDSGEEVKLAKGHSAGVTCLKLVSPTRAVTGSYDCSVKLWDMNAERVRATFTDHASAVNCMDVFENWLAYGASLDGKVVVRDMEVGAVVHTLQL